MSTSGADNPAGAPARPRVSAAELLAAKNTRPIQSPGDLAAVIFESDEELEEFLAFIYAERHHDLADRPWCGRSSSPRHRRCLVPHRRKPTVAAGHAPDRPEPQRTSDSA